MYKLFTIGSSYIEWRSSVENNLVRNKRAYLICKSVNFKGRGEIFFLSHPSVKRMCVKLQYHALDSVQVMCCRERNDESSSVVKFHISKSD